MNARSLYREARARLAAMSVSDAELVAGELMRAFCGMRREELLLSDRELSEGEERAFAAALERRLSGEPLQYILGEWEFCGFPTKVRPGVLIPRGDSEHLARAGAEWARRLGADRILDLCCGSGAVGLAAAKLSGVRATLVDISEPALALAAENAALYGVAACTVRADVTRPFELGERFAVVVCNPPYIAYEERLSAEVTRFEPPQALFAPEGGLFFYRRLVEFADCFLEREGVLLFEIGASQGDAVERLMEPRFSDLLRLRDYGGHDRVVVGRFRGTAKSNIC